MNPAPATLLLAGGAVAVRDSPLPAPAADAALAAFVDWCGVAIGGSVTAPAEILREAMAGAGGNCQLAGGGGSAEAPTAALINGTAAHALELDDIYAPGLYHPGAPTIAAALAVAQHRGASGERLLRGIAIGFEVGNRVAQTLGPSHYAYWHSTGTAGSIAAAAAVSEILELDREHFANALALAGTMAAGLQQTFRTDSMGKPLHSGHAAQTGVVAGLSAAAGFTGTLDVLDGEIGMGTAMADSPSWEHLVAPFGPGYLVQETTVKPYPCCGHTFAAIDAALDLAARGVRPVDLTEIEVRSYQAALTVAGNPAPATAFEARFSIPFVVACALHRGRVRMDTFDGPTLGAPEIRKTMAAVTLRDDREFTRAFPARRGASVVAVEASSARHEASVPDRRGDPRNPLTAEQLDEKFLSVVEGVLGAARAGELRQAVRSAPGIVDVRALRLDGA